MDSFDRRGRTDSEDAFDGEDHTRHSDRVFDPLSSNARKGMRRDKNSTSDSSQSTYVSDEYSSFGGKLSNPLLAADNEYDAGDAQGEEETETLCIPKHTFNLNPDDEDYSSKPTRRKRRKKKKRRKKRDKGMSRIWDGLTVILWVIFIGLAQVCWQYSMISCQYDIIRCIKWLRDKFAAVMLWVGIYTILHYFVLIHATFTRKKTLKWFGLIMTFSSIIYRASVSKGFNKDDFSKANFSLFVVMTGLLTVVYFWWVITLKIFSLKKYGKSGLVLWLVGWVLFYVSIYYVRIVRSCSHLYDSIDPEIKYSEKGDVCRYLKGDICWHYAVDGIFRPLFWGRDDCNKFPTDLSVHIEK